MKVILAEKPSVARDIAQVLGASQKKDSYLEGNNYQVTWAFGHLVQLVNAKQYGYHKWELETLPILPKKFQLQLNENAGAKKQFKVIKELFQQADELIVATDAGREGELIFRYIYQLSGVKKPFKRLWISSLTTKAIKIGFNNLKDGSLYDNLYHSAVSRSEADWLLGINATIAFTLSSKSKSVLSLGRVQTPVLKMICERFLEHENFKPIDYYVPEIHLNKGSITFKASYNGDRIFNKDQANKIIEEVGVDVKCTKSETKPKIENQPLLYDLTTLQASCNRLYGFSAHNTLQILQKLYEKKWITYPRTDSRYITDDLYDRMPVLFNKIKRNGSFSEFIDKINFSELPTISVNNNKVSDHHAILPTGEQYGSLNNDESKIYDMIVKRAIASFSPKCKKKITTYIFNEIFTSSGSVIKEFGWRLVEQEQIKESDVQDLPIIDKDEEIKVIDKLFKSTQTKPKSIHSESSLLKLMETAGKEVEDKELAESIKENGIGTPATRASIIETLIKRTYIVRNGKKLIPTELGLSVYDQIKDLKIASPELTGYWEYKLNKMAKGDYARELFLKEIKDYTSSTVEALREAGNALNIPETHLKCPKCNSGSIIENKKGYGCSKYKEGCGFVIWKTIAGKNCQSLILDNL
ncbi:DNA topoisomerase 3 [Chondrinema litorale]|uniref:DNA topoisomerase 3 n=1 Tax=Chondrinema litorale TaxID=2994555 RepID=UPI0025429B22|nr:DNA topoisomerase 3 [Chondrinema litorale]UZS00082.1 DNA topoisomerase 3 [Chondrinema litorale]